MKRRCPCPWTTMQSPCQGSARKCATRNLAPPHAPLLGSVFHLGVCGDGRYCAALRTTGASMVRMGSPVRFRRGLHTQPDQRNRWSVAIWGSSGPPHSHWDELFGSKVLLDRAAMLSRDFANPGVRSDLGRLLARRFVST